MTRLPVVGVSACFSCRDEHPAHAVDDKYVRVVSEAARALPLVIPALAGGIAPEQWLAELDGLLLTGSPSNVSPAYFQCSSEPQGPHDLERDQTTLPLVKAAVAAGVPVLGICRGFQEINVAYGGSLHQRVHQLSGMLDHRERETDPVEVQYGLAHRVWLEPGGVLQALDLPPHFEVNSLHGQGVERLGYGLRVEARAADGLVEALSVEHAQSFALGVQWHPEWHTLDYRPYRLIVEAFATACRRRQEQRLAIGG